MMSTCCYVVTCYTSSGPGSGSPYPATLPSDELLRCPHDHMNAESVERRGSEGREGGLSVTQAGEGRGVFAY